MENRKVKSINFNWHQVVDGPHDSGETYNRLEVGIDGVTAITENEPHNELQQWNYIVDFQDGSTVRIFNPNYVEYYPSLTTNQ